MPQAMVSLKESRLSKNNFLPSATMAPSAGAVGKGGSPSGTPTSSGGSTAASLRIATKTIASRRAARHRCGNAGPAILALVVAHTLDFHLGQRRMMRVRLARVLPKWDAAMPGYASVLAMYAFALEENGQYRRAEKIARRALVLDPRHPGAIHVIAHVMEMQGRAREGLAFLAATESAWIEGTGFSVH